MHSYHIFLFPFKWDTGKCKIESKKTKIETISEELLRDKNWELTSGKTPDVITFYNELKYFHQFAHSAIFEDMINPAETLVKQFDYPSAIGWEYKITLNRREKPAEIEQVFKDEIPKPLEHYTFSKNKEYILNINKVTLDLYEQGVGIFAFHLQNTQHKKPEDILLINQFGRRIYPPFLDKYFDKFEEIKLNELEGTKFRELPVNISLKDTKKKEWVLEKFGGFENLNNPELIYLPGHIGFFFQKRSNETNYNYSVHEKQSISLLNDKLIIKPVLDDRMFVICWYGAEQLTYDYRRQKRTLKQERKEDIYVLSDLCQRMRGGYEVSGFYRNDMEHRSLALYQTHDSYGYANNDFWYQYVFVDGYSPSCANSILRTEQIEKHTYTRWVENNTLYGITRHSFVCITEPQNKLENFVPNAGFIVDHMQTIYFRMVSLVLAQRSMILNFSERIKSIKVPEYYEDEKKQNETKRAYEDYRKFINEFHQREITAQEQGIELYDMLQQHLRVEYQAKELEKEYEAMNQHINFERTSLINKRMRVLSVLGSLFVIASFILGITNHRFFTSLPSLKRIDLYPISFGSFLLLTTVVFCSYAIADGLLNWNKKSKLYIKGRTLFWIGVACFIFYLFVFQYFID